MTAEETEMPRSRSIAILAKKQEFLGQGGLAGVRMRNDRKCAPAQNLVG
jgi:hypothetical protein